MTLGRYVYSTDDYLALSESLGLKTTNAEVLLWWSKCLEFFEYYAKETTSSISFINDCYMTLDPLGVLGDFNKIENIESTDWIPQIIVNIHKIAKHNIKVIQGIDEGFVRSLEYKTQRTEQLLGAREAFKSDRFNLMKNYANYTQSVYTKDCFFFASKEHQFICKCHYEVGYGFRGKIITYKVSVMYTTLEDAFSVKTIDRSINVHAPYGYFFEEYLRDFYPEELL